MQAVQKKPYWFSGNLKKKRFSLESIHTLFLEIKIGFLCHVIIRQMFNVFTVVNETCQSINGDSIYVYSPFNEYNLKKNNGMKMKKSEHKKEHLVL